jgi:hypothetical protein
MTYIERCESDSNNIPDTYREIKKYQGGFREYCIHGSEYRIRMALGEMDYCDLAEIIYHLYSGKDAECKVSVLTELIEDILDRAAINLWVEENAR